jgi:4'-phosphopantetheinyl transferase
MNFAGERSANALASSQVDIWVTTSDVLQDVELAARLNGVLSAAERHERDRLHHAAHRSRFVATRGLLRYVLSRYAPIAPQAWVFDTALQGKPIIADPQMGARGLSFNLSHSGKVVLLAVAREREVGVDVEEVHRRVPLRIAQRCFTPEEMQQLQCLPPPLRARRFLDLWTLKESFIKARGTGLSSPLNGLAFEWGAGRALRVRYEACLNASALRWSFWQWSPLPGLTAALCVENRPLQVDVISVRRTIPFVCEEYLPFNVLRCTPD